eukprot:15096864-Ditylum_brightwellii.AAC.1
MKEGEVWKSTLCGNALKQGQPGRARSKCVRIGTQKVDVSRIVSMLRAMSKQVKSQRRRRQNTEHT